MYNLNVNVSGMNGLLGVESGGNTPRTPEILNSLIAMSNPLDYSYPADPTGKMGSGAAGVDSTSSSSGSPLGSPANGQPPSVQQTCSQLIKAGLKLTIQSKRKISETGSESHSSGRKSAKMSHTSKEEIINSGSEDEYDDSGSPHTGLTPEDEERRRRRRERNKIAATKCRLKKRERTVNLVTESEVLENQNVDLKGQIQELETQRRQLVDMLSMHRPSCLKPQTNSPTNTFVPNFTAFTDTSFAVSESPLEDLASPTSSGINELDTLSSYERSSSVDITSNFNRLQNGDNYIRPASVAAVGLTQIPELPYEYARPSNNNLIVLPNITNFARNTNDIQIPKIEIGNYDICTNEVSEYTDLDNPDNYEYNLPQCHTFSTTNMGQSYTEHGMDHKCLA